MRVLISCKKCDIKNKVIEFQVLKDLPDFKDRFLIIGKCSLCKESIAQLFEFRKSDSKLFVDSFVGDEAIKVIKREKARIKNKITNGHNYSSFVYGVNKEIKNKKGQVTQIRQYASDYLTDKHTLLKTIYIK